MPNKKQIPRVGTKLPQKPMPKQDKGGGIDPPPRALASVLTSSKQRGGKTPPRCLLLRPLLALNPRETRVDVFRLLAVITIFWNVFQKVLIF